MKRIFNADKKLFLGAGAVVALLVGFFAYGAYQDHRKEAAMDDLAKQMGAAFAESFKKEVTP